MPAVKVKCQGPRCRIKFWASRVDTKYHSEKCRQRDRQENAKFATPVIPKSGIVGITWARVIKRWVVKVREKGANGDLKYVGACKTLPEAIQLQKEVQG
jgi:hypothetical protein